MWMKFPRKILVQEEPPSPFFGEQFYYLTLEAVEYVTAVVIAKSKSN
jgi:hypothetical protein